MRPYIKYPLYIAIAIALMFGSNDLFQVMRYYQHRIISLPAEKLSPRYMHLGDQKPVTVFHPGQFFFTHVDNQRSETCLGHISYRIVSKHMDGDALHTVIWMNYPSNDVQTPPGLYTNDTLLKMPTWLPDGKYSLERLATWICHTNVNIIQAPIGQMNFTVEGPVDMTDSIGRPAD